MYIQKNGAKEITSVSSQKKKNKTDAKKTNARARALDNNEALQLLKGEIEPNDGDESRSRKVNATCLPTPYVCS